MNPKVFHGPVLAIITAALVGCTYFQRNSQDFDSRHQRATMSLAGLEPLTPDEPVLLTEDSGLSDYLAYAALNNPGLEAAFNRWKAALEQIPQVKAMPDPRFTYRYYIQEVETRVGPQKQGLGLSQTFPWFGKLDLQGDAATRAAEAQRYAFEAEKLKLFFHVKEAYYEYYYLYRNIQITEENIELLKSFDQILQTRYTTSQAAHPELIRIQVELGKLEDRRETLLEFRDPIVSRLNASLNRDPNAQLPWPGSFEIETITLDERQLLDWMRHHNPDIQILEAEFTQTQTEIEIAQKEYFPDVTVGFDWIDTGNATGANKPSDSGQDAMMASVSLNLPIWYDSLDAGVREAEYRSLAAKAATAQRRNDLAADLKMSLYQFRDAQRKISLFRDTLIPKATESMQVTEVAFRNGQASFMDMLDSQRVLLEFQLSYERALTDHQKKLAQMEMLVGKQIGLDQTLPVEPEEAVEPLVATD